MQWAPSVELRTAAEAACQLLHHRQDGAAAAQLLEGLLSAARAAAAVCPETAAAVVLALKEADLSTGAYSSPLLLHGMLRLLELGGGALHVSE